MFSIIRASYELMDEVRAILNSNYHLYKDIVHEKDLSEHQVDEEWANRNFQIREFYLARDNGEYVGMASFQNLKDSFAYIGYLYVRNGVQRKGYGSAIIKFLEMRTKQEGLGKICLFAQGKADWALKFYKKSGFSVRFTEKDYIIGFENGILRPFYEENNYWLEKPI